MPQSREPRKGSDRRTFLAALGAAGLVPGAAWSAAADAPLRGLLDRAGAIPEAKARLALLRAADAASLGRAERAILAMIVHGLDAEIALRAACPFGTADGSSPYPVSQRYGAWLSAGEPDAAGRLDAENDHIRAAAARGIVPPAFILDAVIAGERRASPGAAATGAALGRQIALLESLRATASAAPGVWPLPGGPAYHAARLRCATGSDEGAAALDHRLADESARLLARADGLLRAQGLTKGTVGERLRALKRRPEDLYPNDERGRGRAAGAMNEILGRLRPKLADWFDPPWNPGASVKAMSAADVAAGKRGYRDPPAAGRPGAYYPDLSHVDDRPAWTLATVACHETLPGHLLQLARQAIADPHPLQLRYAAGFSEGWAIYAESLADEMGLFSPREQIGMIQSLLFRFARVTVDIGIHVHRWDRARALHHLEETVGFDLFFPFAVEVDRYCIEPAGFAGDATAAIALIGLRPRDDQGAIRRFHDRVLDRGPVSAPALAAIVGRSRAL